MVEGSLGRLLDDADTDGPHNAPVGPVPYEGENREASSGAEGDRPGHGEARAEDDGQGRVEVDAEGDRQLSGEVDVSEKEGGPKRGTRHRRATQLFGDLVPSDMLDDVV